MSSKNRIVITVEGGIVQDVFFNKAANDTEYVVVDFDANDSGSEEDLTKLEDGTLVWLGSPQEALSFDVVEKKIKQAFEN